eukprot:765724-Hanusia_phi.AAC.3
MNFLGVNRCPQPPLTPRTEVPRALGLLITPVPTPPHGHYDLGRALLTLQSYHPMNKSDHPYPSIAPLLPTHRSARFMPHPPRG